MGILAAYPTQRELPLSNWARFNSGPERQRQRMEASLADRLAACHSSLVHDVMKDMGLRIPVLPRTILASSLDEGRRPRVHGARPP